MIDYTWVEWFKELATKIASNDKSYLVDNAKNVDWGKDDAPLLAYGDENIDPMSFLYFLAQRNTRNQYERTFGSVHEKFEITSDRFQTNTTVMPTPSSQIKALFHDGKSFDPDLLWRLFKNAVQTDNNGTAIEPDDFEAALALPNVGVLRLTQTLFLANPSYFLPSDYLSTALPQPMPHGAVTDKQREVESGETSATKKAGRTAVFVFPYSGQIKDPPKDSVQEKLIRLLTKGATAGECVELVEGVKMAGAITMEHEKTWRMLRSMHTRFGYGMRMDNEKIFVHTSYGAYGDYVARMDAVKRQFPGCEPYEINTFLYHAFPKKEESLLIKEPSFFQVGTNPYADESDYWDVTDALPQEARTFKENNCVYTGGPGDQRKFPLSEPKRGDIILVRTGQQKGRAIGVVEENQYASGGWTEEAVIYVHWINKTPAPVTGKLPHLGFGNAEESTISAFRNTDAYKVSFELIDRLIGGGGVKPQPGPEPAVEAPDTSFPLNTILFGPPGTGKTWEAVSYAVAIMDGKAPDELALTEARENVKARFEELREEDRVEFVTFHQNYTYEDFIEGIGPVLDRNELLYELRDGVFMSLRSGPCSNCFRKTKTAKTGGSKPIVTGRSMPANKPKVPISVQVFKEHERLSGLEEAEYAALKDFALANQTDQQGKYRPVLTLKNGRLHTQNYVGVIQTRRGTVIEILPKVDIGDGDEERTRQVFLKMLRTYRGLRTAQFNETGISELRHFNMLDVFVRLFLTNLVLLTQRGLARHYNSVEDNLPRLRGRIRFQQHIRRNAANRARFYVAFDEFTADRPVNRLIHSAIHKLKLRSNTHPSNQQLLHQLRICFPRCPGRKGRRWIGNAIGSTGRCGITTR